MGEALRGVGPKIFWIAEALEEAHDPLEASLWATYGLRLDADFPLSGARDPSCSWRALYSLASNLPADSPFMISVTEGASLWGVAEHLAATRVDLARLAIWQHGGNPAAPRPQPIERPGVEPRGAEQLGGGTTYRADEMADLIARHSRGGT